MSRKPVFLLAALFLAATAWLMLHHMGGTPAPRKEAVKPTRPKPTMALDKTVTEPPPAADEVTLSAEQERMLAQWTRLGGDWGSLMQNEEFASLHAQSFSAMMRNKAWRMKLKQAAVLARKAQGEETATLENTAVIVDAKTVFARPDDALRYARALLAKDDQAVEELYLERMWAIAAEQHFNPNATKEGGLKPIPMTEELREELRKEGR